MDQIISKQTAILAKELGFREKCIYYYCNNGEYSVNEYSDGSGYGVEIDDLVFDYNGMYTDRVSAPLQLSLQGWLREKHGIWVSVVDDYCDGIFISYKVVDYGHSGGVHPGMPEDYHNPEDYYNVLEDGLFKALGILKTRQHEKDNSSNGKV